MCETTPFKRLPRKVLHALIFLGNFRPLFDTYWAVSQP